MSYLNPIINSTSYPIGLSNYKLIEIKYKLNVSNFIFTISAYVFNFKFISKRYLKFYGTQTFPCPYIRVLYIIVFFYIDCKDCIYFNSNGTHVPLLHSVNVLVKFLRLDSQVILDSAHKY